MTAQEFKYTNYMTLEEWKLWKSAYENDPFNKKIYKNSIKNFLSKERFKSFKVFLESSFVFEITPQKHDYWEKISNRTKPVVK